MSAESSAGSLAAVASRRAAALLSEAALDRQPVSGWTHTFYRYPARFSPRFALTAIELFSKPGDLILDPYMGGGTAVVEGFAAGRHVVGNDLNPLAAFIAKVKTTPLLPRESRSVRRWIAEEIGAFSYREPSHRFAPFIDPAKTANLSLARARFIKKAAAAALSSISTLPSRNARDFARAILLRVSQWALDGRRSHTTLAAYRARLLTVSDEMIGALEGLTRHAQTTGGCVTLINGDAAKLSSVNLPGGRRASMVVTSPPYPGVHVLYHRWQVDGRRETAAPYWIAGCNDGNGASFYNFADRRQAATDHYFEASLQTLRGIRRAMADGATIVQLVAFNRPDHQLRRYLNNMEAAGFAEIPAFARNRIWREVPNRKWHATIRGSTNAAKEVVLVHRAV